MEVIEEFQTQAGKLHQECERLRAENNRLEDENKNLRTELSGLMKRVDELTKQVTELPTATLEVTEPEITASSIRIAMQKALADAACDDNKADMILHAVWAYTYLLERLGIK